MSVRVALSGPDRLEQRLHPEDLDHSLQIVGQDVKAHLGSDLVEGPGEEVGAPHPGFQRSEGVFDGLTAHGHGVGHAVEPGLHLVHDGFVPPAPNLLSLSGVHWDLSGQVKHAAR